MLRDEPRPRKRRRPPARRKTVRWSAREVDALLAGVRHHGVGKWAAILRHSKVFNGVRTSVDLKDKWRNLTSPVRAAALTTHPPDPGAAAHAPLPEPPPQAAHPAQHHTPLANLTPPGSPHNSRSSSPLPEADGLPCSPDDSLSDVLSLTHSQQPEHHPTKEQEYMQGQTQVQSQSNSQSPPQPGIHGQTLSQSDPHPHSQSQPDNMPSQCPPDQDVKHESVVLPPPPSESSVSPDVLSAPSAQPQSAHAYQGPFPIPLHPPPNLHPQQLAAIVQLHQNSPHVAAMQQAFGQSLFQSAAALAAYWRRLGHEPNPFAIAAALTASSASPQLNPYVAAANPQSFYPVVEDDDDDDEDDELPAPMPVYPYHYSPILHKDAAHVPYNTVFPQPSPVQTGQAAVNIPTPSPQAAAAAASSNPGQGTTSTPSAKKQPKPNSIELHHTQKEATVDSVKEETTELHCMADEARVLQVAEQVKSDCVANETGALEGSDQIKSDGKAKVEAGEVEPNASKDEEVLPDATSGLEYLNVGEYPAECQGSPEPDRERMQIAVQRSKDVLNSATVNPVSLNSASLNPASLHSAGIVEDQRLFSATDLV